MLRRGSAMAITSCRSTVVEGAVEQLRPLGVVTGIAADVTTAEGRQRTLELTEDGIRVLTLYPTATDTPMMATSGMNRFGGREAAADVAREVVEAVVQERLEVVRGGQERLDMVRRNRTDPEMVDAELRPMLSAMEEAARNHSAS